MRFDEFWIRILARRHCRRASSGHESNAEYRERKEGYMSAMDAAMAGEIRNMDDSMSFHDCAGVWALFGRFSLLDRSMPSCS